MDATSVRPPRDRAAVDQPASSRLLKQRRSVHCDELVDHRHRFRRAIHTFCHDARRSKFQSTASLFAERQPLQRNDATNTRRRRLTTTAQCNCGSSELHHSQEATGATRLHTTRTSLRCCAVAFCCSVPSATLRRAPSRCPRCWTLLTDEQRGYVSPRSALSQQPRKPDAPCALGSWGFRRQNQRSSSADVRP